MNYSNNWRTESHMVGYISKKKMTNFWSHNVPRELFTNISISISRTTIHISGIDGQEGTFIPTWIKFYILRKLKINVFHVLSPSSHPYLTRYKWITHGFGPQSRRQLSQPTVPWVTCPHLWGSLLSPADQSW